MTTFYPATNDSGALGDYSTNTVKESSDLTFITARSSGVWMLGDSITVSDSYEFAQRLYAANGGTTAVFAQPGAPTRLLADYALAKKQEFGQPDVLIMATGTNDIFFPEVMPAQIARIKSEFNYSKIIWVTTYVQRWSQSIEVQLADSRNSGRVNGAILNSGVDKIVDWGRFLTNKSGRTTNYLRDGVHTTDGVTTTYSGRGARNQLIVDSALSLG